MERNKFKKFDRVYLENFYHVNGDVFAEGVNAIQVYIEEVKGSIIKATTLERYGFLKKARPHDLRNIVNKKKKRKGKEIDFTDDEFVSVRRTYSADSLLTEDEMKMKMIKYIANDFSDDDYYKDENYRS